MTATKQVQDAWFAGAVGRPMNPDNAYGLQCKDVADDYCITLFGGWIHTIRPGNGKDVFNNANPDFFIKVANNPNDPNQVPPRGAIINWGASRAVPEGHVAVVESADGNGVTVIQQDGYVQYAARRVRLPYRLANGAMVVGWLIPKLAPEIPMANHDQVQQAYREILERGADQGGLNHYVGRYTYEFVRADLQGSVEYRDLQNRKATEAKAAADEAVRAAALEAEANRLAEERAAIEAAEAAEAIKKAEAEAAAKAAEEAAKVPEISAPVIVHDEGTVSPRPPFEWPTIPTPAQPKPSTPSLPEAPKMTAWLKLVLWLHDKFLAPRIAKKKG